MPSTVTQVSPSTQTFLKALQWGGYRWTDGSPPSDIAFYFGSSGQDLSSAVWAQTHFRNG
jgi:hypothetical protein